jgi:hypothetical protein
MPYKNAEDRRACYARWVAKNPDRYKELYALQNAKKTTQKPRLTTEEKIEKATIALARATARLAKLSPTDEKLIPEVGI